MRTTQATNSVRYEPSLMVNTIPEIIKIILLPPMFIDKEAIKSFGFRARHT